MCGIVGAIADRDVVPVLIEGLKRLEYRGYDSAGIAVLDGVDVRRVRRTGRVSEMESAAQAEGFHARTGTLLEKLAAGYYPQLTGAPYLVPPLLGQQAGIKGALLLAGR